MSRFSRWTQVAMVLALLAAGGRAATITVGPGGAYPTIQAGVDAAGPGDTLLVQGGTYRESVAIPAGKFGLELLASGRVILDARAAGGAGAGPGIKIDSPSVTVRGFTIQNAAADPNPPNAAGYGIECTQPGLVLRELSFCGNRDGGVFVTNGDVTRITDCEFQGEQGAVEIEGDSVTVERVTVRNCRGVGLEITGNAARVMRCTISNTEADAIVINGDGAVLEQNVVRLAGAAGLLLAGDGILVRNCEVRGTRLSGIECAGAGVVIEHNLVEYSAGAGISHSGDQPTINDNRIANAIGESAGLRLAGVTGSGLASGNRIEDCSDEGLRVEASCSGLTLLDNRVIGCGNAFEAGFHIRGDGHQLKGNRAIRNACDGFGIEGDAIVLRRNRAVGNGQDGFDVSGGNGVKLIENVAKGNLAEGLENNASGTIVRDNKSVQNRIDFGNDGSLATFSGNTIGDGSNQGTSPEID